MKIIHIELLSQTRSKAGDCIGKLRVHGTLGERIELMCRVPMVGRRQDKAVHAALAQDALRQIRRLPEFRRRSLQVAPNAMPRAPMRRIIRLSL